MNPTGAASRGPIIVSALFGATDFAWLNGLRQRHFPPERNQLDAHLTLFHHLPPDVLAELKQRLNAATRGQRRPDARIAGLMNLGGGVAFRVESLELEGIREDLADAFAPLLIPQDRAGWRPHVTIQNKVPSRVARALLDELSAGFRPCSLEITGLAAWEYRGGPWALLSRHMFA